MHIGLVTDSLSQLSLNDLLKASAELKIDCLEFPCGNWSPAPHVALDRLLESDAARREFLAKIADHGLRLSALNCSGNPLHPGAEGLRQHEITVKTFQLARRFGVDTIVMMSGLPGGPGDANPNWITTEWPLSCREILKWQWEERLVPYWREMVTLAADNGVKKICLELHGYQAVYNPSGLLRLREIIGPLIGANYDPSHPMWMGADPLSAVRHLGEAIYYVHAKDTRIEPGLGGIDGVLDTVPGDRPRQRAWNYVTLGTGHGEEWWRQFVMALRLVGYDGVLSIEHEDTLLDPRAGVAKSVALLRNVI
jgi:sugar phosphate isomerase/epimerase